MSFFEPLPVPKRGKPKRRRKGTESRELRPTLLVPGYVNRSLVLAASDQRAVIVHGISCFPTGFAFQLQTVNRYEPECEEDSAFDEFPTFHFGPRSNENLERALRFGIEFPNGKRVTNLDTQTVHGGGSDKQNGPHLEFGGGGGGGGDWRHEVWVWPLPTEGPVIFACEWPAYGIPESHKQIEGKVLRKAAEKAKPIFAE